MKKTIFIALFSGFMAISPALATAQTLPESDMGVASQPQSSCIDLKHNLYREVRDTQTNGEVSILQNYLASKGYFEMEPTGYFGPLTVRAIKKFQILNEVPPTGYVGPLTRTAIKSSTCVPTNSVEHIDLNELEDAVISTSSLQTATTTDISYEDFYEFDESDDASTIDNNSYSPIFSGGASNSFFQEFDDVVFTPLDTDDSNNTTDNETTPADSTDSPQATSTDPAATSTDQTNSTSTPTTTAPVAKPTLSLSATIDAIQGEYKNFSTVTFKATPANYNPASVILAVVCPSTVFGNIPGEDTERCNTTMPMEKASDGAYQTTLKFRNTTTTSLTLSAIAKILNASNKMVAQTQTSVTVQGKK